MEIYPETVRNLINDKNMFIDYYELFEIDSASTQEEIKAAFRKQALKWHPDRNTETDTTRKMQMLNEAYLILKDVEARMKYDIAYESFLQYKYRKSDHKKTETEPDTKQETYTNNDSEFYDFEVADDDLEKWIRNARKQAVELAKQTIKDLKGMVSAGLVEGAKGAGKQLFYQIIAGFIFFVIIALFRSCGA